VAGVTTPPFLNTVGYMAAFCTSGWVDAFVLDDIFVGHFWPATFLLTRTGMISSRKRSLRVAMNAFL